jgi:hypothetical protein
LLEALSEAVSLSSENDYLCNQGHWQLYVKVYLNNKEGGGTSVSIAIKVTKCDL